MADAAKKNEDQVPLLSDEILYPNCPGCKCAHLSAKGAAPPLKELLMVASVVLCNALPISSLYPFIYFMVEDFHIAKETEDIGYYAGAIGSIFMFGRFLSSMPWGVFADKYGRKSVMYFGLLSIIVFQPLFGISKNFYMALFARFMLGTFNGMLGPVKAFSSEICNAENELWGLTVVSTTWSLELIIGPALGGFLSRPAINYPGMFSKDSLFGRYPYLMASLFQAAFAVLEIGVVYYLPETIHIHDKESSKDLEETDVEQSMVEIGKPQKESLWRNWPLMASVAVYCMWSLHDISFTEVFSLWCVSPVETGGLSFRTSDLGVVLGISGFAMMSLQLIIFPVLAKYLGPILVTRIPAIMVIPLVVCFPFVPMLHGHMQWIVLNALAVIRNTMSTMVITGTFLLVNNAVPTDARGAANGFSMSCVSFFRAVGPAAAGAFFAWGQSRHKATFLPDSQMVYAILAFICFVTVFTTFPPFLPESLNRPLAAELTGNQLSQSDDIDDEKLGTN